MNSISPSRFSVSEISQSDKDSRKILTKKLRHWRKILINSNAQCNSEEKKQLSNANSVALLLLSQLKEKSSPFRFLFAKDSADKIQSIAPFRVFGRREGMLTEIVTHPYNISPKIGGAKHPPVRGAGSSIIRDLFKKAVDEKLRLVSVLALEGTVPFYKKHKFHLLAPQNEKEGMMEIKTPQIRSFLSSSEAPKKRKLEENDSVTPERNTKRRV